MVEIDNIKFGENNPFVLIAGPCVIENREITFTTAKTIFEITAKLNIPFVFKSSFKKANRTSLNSFTGLEFSEAVDILKEIKNEFKVPIVSDVHTEKDIELIASVVDILQIPAFLCRQTDLLLAAGNSGKIVNVKKGQFLALKICVMLLKKLKVQEIIKYY